jgi:nitroreductase
MTTEITWNPDCFFEIVQARRTVRAFAPAPVPDEDLCRILDAARRAPSSGNQQPWRFLVVRDRATLDQLHADALALTLEAAREQLYTMEADEAAAYQAQIVDYLDGFLGAPVYVVLLLDADAPYHDYVVQDGALAAAHLMLAARALGYGTAYGTDAIPERAMRYVLRIPERYQILCILPIGVPVAWPPAPPKRELEAFVAYETLDDVE